MYKKETVIVTGSKGFVGQNLMNNELFNEKYEMVGLHRGVCDLTSYRQTKEFFENFDDYTVIHCAGYNGGISFNINYPFDILHTNNLINNNIVKVLTETKYTCKMFIGMCASCAYDSSKDVLNEDDVYLGTPHDTVKGHGYAKRNLLYLCDMVRNQYGIKAFCVTPTTLYGPHDKFDKPDQLKVVSSILLKMTQNFTEDITLLGTGKPKRAVMYIDDFVESLFYIIEDGIVKPIFNIQAHYEYSVREIARIIKQETAFCGMVIWDDDYPDGQMRKKLVGDKYLVKYVGLSEGIRKTKDWLQSQIKE